MLTGLLRLTLLFLFFSLPSKSLCQNYNTNKDKVLDTTEIGALLDKAAELRIKDRDQAIQLYLQCYEQSKRSNFLKYIYISGNNAGYLFTEEGDSKKALQYAMAAYKAAKDLNNNKYIAQASYGLGAKLKNNGQYHEAIEKYNESFLCFEKEGIKGMLKNIRHALGLLYLELELYDKAILEYKKAYQLAKEEADLTSIQLYNISIIEAFQDKKQNDSVSVYITKAEALMPQIEEGSFKEILKTYLLEFQIEHAIRNKNFSEAFIKGDSLLKKAKEADISLTILVSLLSYGDIHFYKEEYDKAANYYSQAYKKSQEISYNGLDEDIYRKIAATYTELNRMTEASNFWKQYAIVNDSIRRKTLKNQMAYQSELLQNNLKDKEISEQQLIIEKKNKELYIKNNRYYAATACLVIISLLFYIIIQHGSKKAKAILADELQKKNKEVTDAHKILREVLDNKTQFLNSITHELRTPLNILSSCIYILKDKAPVKDQNIEQLEETNQYLLGYVNNIIDLNTFKEDDTHTLDMNTINIASTMHIFFGLGFRDLDSNIIQTKISENIPDLVRGDYVKVTQVLFNLSNCLLECFDNGVLDTKLELLESTKENIDLLFSFTIESDSIYNSKLNILLKQLANYQDTQQTWQDIRVKIIKNHLKLLLASLEVSKANKSNPTVALKIRFKPVVDDTKGNQANDKFDILLAEDNKITQKVTKSILQNLGYTCTIANNGLEAVQLFEKKSFGLVLMDIMMPVMDGFEAANKIRSLNKNVKIIALTAISIPQNRKRFKQAGIKHILGKPVSVDMLTEKIVAIV